MTNRSILSVLIYGLTASIAVVAFVYPFLLPVVQSTGTPWSRAGDTPFFLTLLVSVCFIALLFEVQSQVVGTKFVALL